MECDSLENTDDLKVINIGGRKKINPKLILLLEADINYTTVHLCNGEKFTIATTLKKVKETIDSHGKFVRISNKFVVNFDCVTNYCDQQLILSNDRIIPFSRRKRKIFMEKIA
jgi:two-component system LytT family response regulator